ncbi:hypothetical protein [Embleya hyalina]|uniref:Acylphosphatase-like domain-containing protein n=1 Tax=Embleya hyalina TaxID=516124 RepID=A0A401YTB3_9ACTN|nr:hypothetical protein [Embleya hyalina]GCD97857.1 hypothetical protein EHYA_05554 [Embleya hyalina]
MVDTGAGVVVEVEGPPAAVAEFRRRVGTDAPPSAAVGSVVDEELPVDGVAGFTIPASPADRFAG